MQAVQDKNKAGGILGLIERIGNKIPDITILFIGAFVICCVLSAVLSTMHFGYVHPTTGKEIVVNNMLSGKNLVTLLSKMVSNYSGFPPLGMVIVATLGIGIADGSIEAVGQSLEEVLFALLEAMEAEDMDNLTLLAGADLSQDEFDALVEKVEQEYDDLEIDAQRGEQPLYPLVFSLE